jgi:hydroxymethylpyrimidine pyrophosphatase-like HAD family hydrolase
MYKALITDLDGTAIAVASFGDDIDLATQQAMSNAINQGFIVACATGRDWNMAEAVITKLGITAPCVIEGGSRIIDPITSNTLWEKSLEPGESLRVFKIFKQLTPDATLTTSADTPLRPMLEVDSVPNNLRYLYSLGVEVSVANQVQAVVNEGGKSIAHLTPSWMGNGLVDVHVTHIEATKAHAIKIWQARVKVTKAETIGMGDSGNDLPLLQASGLKIAVANASEEVMSMADYVAPAQDDHSLKHVIDKFLFNQV